jgi:penicillin amidase
MRTLRPYAILLALALAATACSYDDSGNNDEPNATTADAGEVDAEADAGNVTTPDAADVDTGMPDSGMTELPEGFFIDGMDATATVHVDDKGVLHIDCQTNNDCFRVQGYFHAKDRFFQMDVRRRFARGRIAALLGALNPAIIELDLTQKTIFSTRDGAGTVFEAALAAVDDDTRAMFEAYSDGVNAWIRDYELGRNDAEVAPAFDFLRNLAPNARPEPWTPIDSVASGFLLLQDLSDKTQLDIRHGRAYAELDPTVAFDLLTLRSLTGSNTYAASGETFGGNGQLRQMPSPQELAATARRMKQAKRALEQADARLSNVAQWRTIFLGEDNDGTQGSNNWVIGADRTADGSAYLANDPHLALSNPALWYMVEIDSKTNGSGDLHTFGVSFAGFPGQLLGHNEDLAWGGTVVRMDLSDAYTETLTADGTGVVIDGNDVPFEMREVTVEVARGMDETFMVPYVPQHGPVLSIDTEAGTAVTFKWSGQEALTDLEMFYSLMRATNLAEAKSALEKSTSTNQNWVVVDRNKEMGWFPYNAVPNRPWASLSLAPWLPLPGDGSAEWEGTLPLSELPQIENPANGVLITANQDATGAQADGDPTNDGYPYFQSHVAIGARHQRIVDMVEAGANAHDIDSMVDIQGDDYMVLAELALPELLLSLNGQSLSNEANAVVSTLTSWDYTCPSGYEQGGTVKSTDAAVISRAAGCHAFHAFFYAFSQATFGDELANTPFNGNSGEVLRSAVHILVDPTIFTNGAQYFDDVTTTDVTETRETIVLGAIEEAATYLAGIGANEEDWIWGDVHEVVLRADLLDNFGLPQFNLGPIPAPGGQYTVNVANVVNGAGVGDDDRDYSFSNGASMRIIVQVDDNGLSSKMTLPGGQVQFPDSDFYDNLLADWIDVNHFDVLFEREAVENAAVETYSFEATPAP